MLDSVGEQPEPAATRQVAFRPRAGLPPVKIIYTGYPPPLRQIACQVRSASGMTIGFTSPNGQARMPPAFVSRSFVRPVRGGSVPAAASATPFYLLPLARDKLLDWLRQLDENGEPLPPMADLYDRFGRKLLTLLRNLAEDGEIALFLGSPGYYPGSAVIKLLATGTHLSTPDAPEFMVL